MAEGTCLSGQNPVALADAPVCNLGFICHNTNRENPPKFCPPTKSCQAVRLQPSENICQEQQGSFEPVACTPGYYCPPQSQEQIRCPPGSYCPLGSYHPKRCAALSICAEGSSREISVIGFVILGVLYLLCAILGLGTKAWKQKKGLHAPNTFPSARTSWDQGHIEYAGGPAGNFPALDAAYEQGSIVREIPHFGTMSGDRQQGERGLDFQLRDVCFSKKGVPRPVLQGVACQIPKGHMFGIMGPSGAGKLEFMAIMQIFGGKLGCILAFGRRYGLLMTNRYRHCISFVPQDDIVFPNLTVWENILHTATIRLGGTYTTRDIMIHVDNIITYLGLDHIRDQQVGSPENRGISGGERKRVSLAREIVAMPSTIILDEPTSGLDATTALSVMGLLKDLSGLGITVICAIHQPRRDVFDLLDDLMLLVSGRPIYVGPQTSMLDYFQSIGFTLPKEDNPADTVMDLIKSRQVECDIPWFEEKQALAGGLPSAEGRFTEHCPAVAASVMAGPVFTPPDDRAAWLSQVLTYIRCGAKQQKNQPFGILLEIVTASCCGVLIGLSIYESKGHIFQGYFREPFQPLSSAVDYKSVPTAGLLSSLAIKMVFGQEVHSGHSASAYFIGKDLCTLPRILISTLHFTAFLKVLAATVIPVHILFCINAAYFFCIYGLASLVASLAPRQDALLLAMLTSLTAGVLDGSGPRLDQVKHWKMGWLWYICPGTWYSEAWFSEHVMPFSYLYDTDAAARFTGYITGRTGFDIGLMIVIGVVYRILAYLSLSLPRMRGPVTGMKGAQ
ncbi:P-loop containing nucleoside triphosphate hydrolase protein [Aspergillus pseudocaelatus]|uniref:P-loop containing nucleoside triphosphate hydrolase protein n=1 Tax=Aspergillus pseudocaelatus TaxID=1825620 RepID=A0ABQ6WQU9_9EURO|nr:P-loop containing nucleoside triphosphate hydrolase protein [Aspergillus pseudocaelatus]